MNSEANIVVNTEANAELNAGMQNGLSGGTLEYAESVRIRDRGIVTFAVNRTIEWTQPC